MSEHQYYEFVAIDHPLTEADQEALRALSSRAEITATRFINTYNWGDFRGNPLKLMEKWFDLHLYLANWGSRRLMMRLPQRLVDRQAIAPFISELDDVELHASGGNLILDINMGELDIEDWEDGSGVLTALAPLRADILQGDLRLFYLIWLMAVDYELLDDETPEPLPGLGPLNGSLRAFASFFGVSSDLVDAAADRPADPLAQAMTPEAVSRSVAALPPDEKDRLLVRICDGDPFAAVELRKSVGRQIKNSTSAPPLAPRTVGELRARAEAVGKERALESARKAAAEREQKAEAARQAKRARLDAIIKRGESVWTEIESEIERRNGPGYDRAASLLRDLHDIATEKGGTAEFSRRLSNIRVRHAQKARFIDRLVDIR